MDNPTVFNNYDIRGACPSEVNEELAERLGRAIGTYAKGLVVVGGDTRDTTPSIKQALIDGILSCGVDVTDVGIGPTDFVSLAGNHYNAKLSVMVTASHHPWSSNGFKLMYTKGNGFSNEELVKVKDIYISKLFLSAPLGTCENREEEFKEIYIERAISVFKEHFNAIDAKVVVDCANGAASVVLPALLEKLGAEIIKVNCETKQDESINPEPEDGNRCYLADMLKENNADIAVGCDPDADRVFAIDADGRWVTGDELFSVLAKAVGAKKISASLDTSSMLQEATGAEVVLTRVGDIFVSKKGIEISADFAGEPNGHYTFPRFSWYNSGTFAALLLCAVAKNLRGLVSSLPKYFVKLKKFEFNSNDEKLLKMEEIMRIAKEKYGMISDIDGVKFRNKNCVVLVRPSGTSPVIRVKVEGKDEEEATTVLDEVCNLV